MSALTSADQIRRRMAEVRRELHNDVDDIVVNAQALTDWRSYVSSAPWLAIGCAAAAGYLVVPRKLQIVSPSEGTLAKLAKKNRLVVEHKPEAAARSGVAHSVFTIMSNMAMRAALAYAGQKLGKVIGQQTAEPAHPQERS